MISIEIKNLESFRKAILSYPEKSVKNFNDAIKSSLLIIQSSATQKAPKDTGNLKAGWEINIGTLKGTLRNKMDYAIFVHEGTGIYGPMKRAITPKSKSFLAWQKDGVWRFARSVKGMKPRPFLQEAVDEKSDQVNKVFDEALAKTLKEL